MDLISSLISKIDIFGIPVTLSACSKEKFTSAFGGFLTLTVVTLTVLFSVRSTVECLTRASASISSQTRTLADPGPLELNSSNFNFAVGYDGNQYPLSASIYGFEMLYISVTRLSNGSRVTNTTRVPLVQCTSEYWKGYEPEFELYGLSNYLCPSADVYGIAGTTTSQTFRSIRLQIVNCVNGTNAASIACAPQTEIDSIVAANPPRVTFFYTNNDFNFDDYETPVNRYISFSTISVSPGLFTKLIGVYLAQQTIFTDDNPFMSSEPSQNITYFIKDLRNDVSNPSTVGAQAIYMTADFLKSPELFFTVRTFPKFEGVLSTIGGVASVLVGILAIFAGFYNEYSMNAQIANTLYEFEIQDKNTKSTPPARKKKKRPCCKRRPKNEFEIPETATPPEKKKRRSCCKRKPKEPEDPEDKKLQAQEKVKDPDVSSITILSKRNNEAGAQAKGRMDAFIESFQNYEKNFGKTLPYSLWQFLKMIVTCGKRKTDRLMAQATERMHNEIDITYILKKLGEIDKLKEVLFNEDQVEVFCYARAPKITDDKETETKTPVNSKPNQKGKTVGDIKTLRRFAVLFKSYKKLQKQNTNGLNKKLIQLMGTDMQNILSELDFNLKNDPALKESYYRDFSVRAFEEMQIRRRKNVQDTKRANIQDFIEKRVKRMLNRRRLLKNANNISTDSVSVPSENRKIEENVNKTITVQKHYFGLNSPNSKT